MQEVMTLSLNKVRRDEDQPRKIFESHALKELKAAVKRWGQMHPIIVRKIEDDYVIVDGERRWRVLQELSAELPETDRFASIRAVVGTDDDSHASFRKARQLVANATSQDLTPAEKAETISALKKDETITSSEQYGLTPSNLKLLKRLAAASDYVREFGKSRVYTVAVESTGAQGEIIKTKEKREYPPLPLTHLTELVALDNALRAWDGIQLRATRNTHTPIASSQLRKVGERAQKEQWGKVKIKDSCDRIASSITKNGEISTRRTRSESIVISVKKLETKVQSFISGDFDEEEINIIKSALESVLQSLVNRDLVSSKTT